MEEVSVLGAFMLMEGCVLYVYVSTRTLSRVLAMSRGLQTVTEMMPAMSPETKSCIFLCVC